MKTITVECQPPARSGLDPIREAERISIRRFVEENAHLLTGRVLDFGAGKPGTCREPQPYRALLTAAIEYVPVDRGDAIPDGHFDSVLCTQVIHLTGHYILHWMSKCVKPGAPMVMTYQTNWDEVEAGDHWRYTRAGMEILLKESGWLVEVHERRAEVKIGGFRFPLGYGVVAVAV